MAIDWTKIQKKYEGLWVAFAEDEQTVLGAGKTVKEALQEAKKKSGETPFLFRMPPENLTYVG